LSAARGQAVREVATGFSAGTGGGGPAPVASNDADNTHEDTAVTINVLANDSLDGNAIEAGAATVTIVSSPSRGSAGVNADGTITYTPYADVSGVDTFSYTTTVNNVGSNIATVTVIVNPVNDAPIAVADTVTGAAGTSLTISPLANDVDVDGDSLVVKSLGAVSGGPAGAVTSLVQNADNTVTFTADLGGTYSFGYVASDGQYDSPATVTVTMVAPETINVASAEYRTGKNRWKVSGTSSITANHEVKIVTTGNATCVSTEVGRTVSAAGAYALDLIGPGPGIGCTQVRAESALGGVSAATTIRVRN
jgi:hypothetical protein